MATLSTFLNQLRTVLPTRHATSEPRDRRFGTFAGVFTPTVLTILGALMYLRTGWVVGNAGLVGGLLIVLLANTITICTGLSVSSIATNIRVRAGGAFSIISQSLGLEVLRGVFFRPNALFLPILPDTEESTLQTMLDRAAANEVGAILFAKHPVTELGREQVINVWIREQSPDWPLGLQVKSNIELSLLLAYQIARNWSGRINLISIVSDAAEQAKGEAFMRALLDLTRLPRATRFFVPVGALREYLPQSPPGDLNIFGLQERASLQFMRSTVEQSSASCIFVRDSGFESVLA